MEKRQLTLCLDVLRCPNSCRHCYQETGGGHYKLSLADIRRIVERLKGEAESAGVDLTVWPDGKEPMAHPEYFEIMAYLDDMFHMGKARGVVTNGWSIARDPNFLVRLREYNQKLERIQLTLTDLEDAHDRFVGRRGAFRDLEIAAKRILAEGLKITWVYVAHGDNIDRLPAMSVWTHSRGFVAGDQSECVFLVKPQGRGRYLRRLRLGDLEHLPKRFRDMVLAGATWGHMEGLKTEKDIVEAILHDALPTGCCCEESCYNSKASSLVLECEYNGDVYPPCHEDHPAFLLGNINRDSLETILDRYTRDAIPALHARRVLGLKELAVRHGRRDCDELHHGCSICRTLVNRHLGLEPHGELAWTRDSPAIQGKSDKPAGSGDA